MTNPTPWRVDTAAGGSQIIDDAEAVVSSGDASQQATFEAIAIANSQTTVPAVHPPIGSWCQYGGDTPPEGYIFADGGDYSRVTYQYLFTVYREKYGAGDGITTFGVPNLADRFLKGKGPSSSLGDVGGSSTLAHSGAAVADHSINLVHSGAAVAAHTTALVDDNRDGTQRTMVLGATHSVTQASAHVVTLVHGVTQPADHTGVEPEYFVCNYIIRCW